LKPAEGATFQTTEKGVCCCAAEHAMIREANPEGATASFAGVEPVLLGGTTTAIQLPLLL
jgi:hypothetical protein